MAFSKICDQRLRTKTFIVSIITAMCMAFSVPSQADSTEGLSVSVDFENVDGLTIASWTIKNVSDTPIRPGTMIADYACADGFVERVEHVFRVTISPGAEYKHDGSFVCAGREKALSYYVIGNKDDMSMPISGNEIFYQLPCGSGAKVFVILKWNKNGYYDFETATNYKNILTKDTVEDDSFAERVCDPDLPPTGKMLIEIKEWMKEKVLKHIGDPKKGYIAPAGGFVVRG
jgi:hypothetical protein